MCCPVGKNGGIAQLARAIGSYPIGRGFKSNFRYHAWQSLCQRNAVCREMLRPVGQEAKTPPFHGGNGSSILPRVIFDSSTIVYCFFVFSRANRPHPRFAKSFLENSLTNPPRCGIIIPRTACGYGGIGRRAGFRILWATPVQVRPLLPAFPAHTTEYQTQM